MSDVSLSVIALGGLAASALVAALWRTFFSRLASVPGPFLARFTDLWYAYRMYRGDFEKENLELHRKHGMLTHLRTKSDYDTNVAGFFAGPIVRYGVDRYSISDPMAAKVIYGTGTKSAKSSWYESWSNPHPDAWNLFGDRDARRHAANRRQYQNTYSMSSLVNYESFVDDCADLFCQRLEEMSARDGWGRAVDMGHWLQCYAFDVIGMITYSKRIGFLDLGEDVGGVMQNLEDHLAYASLIGIYPWLHPIVFPIRNWLAGSRGKGRQYIINYTQECMAAHQAKPKAEFPEKGEDGEQTGALDFLSKFMRKNSEDPAAFTTYHALAGCTSNMVAGSDTTSISLSAILYYVLRDPAVLKRLRDEIDAQCPQDKTSPHITFSQSNDMPYLQAVIKEALRVHPATGLPLERIVPKGGATISGVFFPEGVSSSHVSAGTPQINNEFSQVTVGINCWVEHSNKAIFGEDADIFNPDRWLQDDKERLSTMTRHWMPVCLLF